MADSLRFGPPFRGMTENPFETDGRCLLSVNYFPRGNKLQKRYGWSSILTGFRAELGIRGYGTKRGSSTIVGMQGTVDGFLTVNMANASGITSVACPNETPRGIYTFAALAETLYAAGGSNLIRFDCDNLLYDVVTMAPGIEIASKSYLAKAPPAKCIVSHQNLMWYANLESADLPIFGTTTGDLSYTDDYSWMVGANRVNFSRRHILYSDPYHPEQVQSLHNFAIEDDGNGVVAIHSFRGGLLILTELSAFYLTGTWDNWRIDRLGSCGCVSPTSVASSQDVVYWLGPDAIYYMGEDLAIQTVKGLDWIWNGDSPTFKSMWGGTGTFFDADFFVTTTNEQATATAVFDGKQNTFILEGVFKAGSEAAGFRFNGGLMIDGESKSASLVWPCPPILGSAGNTDLGSIVSDVIGADDGLTIWASPRVLSWKNGIFADSYSDGTPYNLNTAQYLTCFKDANAYLRTSAVRVFTSPQDLTVFVESWERNADMETPAGATVVAGAGSSAPDTFSDSHQYPRWGDGNKWYDATTNPDPPRWIVTTPGVVKVPVLGHGRALAINLLDSQVTPSPILGLSMDVTADGD